MAIEITIPRLGWSMEEGTFVEWLKPPGETVRIGEPLFAVESDKITMEVEALNEGILFVPAGAPQQGAVVKAGQLIGYLLEPGEAQPVLPQSPVVTPRARRVAAELGVDPLAVRGTGKGGRVREQDVRAAVGNEPKPVVPTPLPPSRRTIAGRMMESWRQTVPVTLMRRADASRLTALRNRWKLALQPSPAPSFTDIAVKLAAIAITRHPIFGTAPIHIGIAVDTEHGLLVPVIRDAGALPLEEVAAQSRKLIEAARRRQITAADLTGSVFTISNLGGFGVEAFTPILNFPETAVLGLGAIRWEPVVLPGGQIVARELITLSLTFDHRVVDGAPAARFLHTIAALMEEPPADLALPVTVFGRPI